MPTRPHNAICLIGRVTLVIHLVDCYNQFSATRGLEEAIVPEREALNFRLQGHPDQSISLINLAAQLSARYDHLGAMQDLDEAIILDQEALTLCATLFGHRCRATTQSISPLGTISLGQYRTSFEWLRRMPEQSVKLAIAVGEGYFPWQVLNSLTT